MDVTADDFDDDADQVEPSTSSGNSKADTADELKSRVEPDEELTEAGAACVKVRTIVNANIAACHMKLVCVHYISTYFPTLIYILLG